MVRYRTFQLSPGRDVRGPRHFVVAQARDGLDPRVRPVELLGRLRTGEAPRQRRTARFDRLPLFGSSTRTATFLRRIQQFSAMKIHAAASLVMHADACVCRPRVLFEYHIPV